MCWITPSLPFSSTSPSLPLRRLVLHTSLSESHPRLNLHVQQNHSLAKPRPNSLNLGRYSVLAPPDTPAWDDTVIRKLSQFWPDGPGNFYTVNNHVYLLSREIRSQLVEVSGFCDGVNPFWAQIWRNHSRWSSNLSCFTRNFAPFEYFSSILDI